MVKAVGKSIYERRRTTIRIGIAVAAIVIAIVSLIISDRLIGRMAGEERKKIELWASATRAMLDEDPRQTMALVFEIIESNRTIPVILATSQDSILSYNNIKLPEEGQEVFLARKLQRFKSGYPPILIDMGVSGKQYIYYADSSTLKQLLRFPYIQLIVLFIFIAMVVGTIYGMKRAEQNRIWEGLSKETAHQLGTPISSLMAWSELLRADGANEDLLAEIAKDTDRLKMIADRFQKIGSEPSLRTEDMGALIARAVDYLRNRISQKVIVSIAQPERPLFAEASEPLLSWVLENLIKNGVDAMQGEGNIDVAIYERGRNVAIDVTDSGRGIPKSKYKTIFLPGHSTKANGWGLGLSLAKRIVEEYHRGRIFVSRSELGHSTTFRILLPGVAGAAAAAGDL